MKKLIAAAGLGAAIAIGSLAGAGTASANAAQDNYEFIQSLNNNGISVTDLSAAISYGHGICANIADGATGVDEQNRVYYNTPWNFTWNMAYNYVGAAAEAFCPWYVPSRVYPAVW
jgi:hypothetical protein